MSDLEQQIKGRVDAFVQELTGLVQQSVLSSISQTFGGRAPARAARGRARAAAEPAGGRGRPARRGRRKGQKRSPKELARLVDAVRGYVSKHPGEGVEKMASDLGENSRELVLPIKKLISGGEIRTRGEKRATKYFPARARKAA
jgi:hypothetical protein